MEGMEGMWKRRLECEWLHWLRLMHDQAPSTTLHSSTNELANHQNDSIIVQKKATVKSTHSHGANLFFLHSLGIRFLPCVSCLYLFSGSFTSRPSDSFPLRSVRCFDFFFIVFARQVLLSSEKLINLLFRQPDHWHLVREWVSRGDFFIYFVSTCWVDDSKLGLRNHQISRRYLISRHWVTAKCLISHLSE